MAAPAYRPFHSLWLADGRCVLVGDRSLAEEALISRHNQARLLAWSGAGDDLHISMLTRDGETAIRLAWAAAEAASD